MSILSKHNKVPKIIKQGSKDNVDYINVCKHTDSPLGKKLSLGHPIEVDTVFGVVGNMRSAMDYITKPNYPVKLLAKKKLTKKDIDTIPKNSKHVPNYWAIIAYIFCCRVEADVELQKELKENKLTFTSYNKKSKQDKFLNKDVVINTPNNEMGKYLAIIRIVSDMLKKDEFTEENIGKFIEDCKDEADKDIFYKVAFNIESKQVS